MIYIAIYVFGFAVIQFIVALMNLFLNNELNKISGNHGGLVSVLIPARNEEHTIRNLLNDLINQDYKNIEIIVFNDESTDCTASFVSEMAEMDNRIKLINSEGLPKGWLGKNYACHCLALQANGDYFLFLDADVRIGNEIIHKTLTLAEKRNYGLISIFPLQIMESFGEWITVPVMNYILLSLLPLWLVGKSKFSSLAAANGQFMLFNAKVYRNLLPHKRFRFNAVEDIKISRFLKSEKINTACFANVKSVSCRMYRNFNEAISGFSKNITDFFGGSLFLAILFWLTTTFGFFAIFDTFSAPWFYVYLSILLLTKIFVSMCGKQNVIKNVFLFLPQQISMLMMIINALRNFIRKDYKWKGRNIY